MIDNKFNTITYKDNVICFYRNDEYGKFMDDKKKIHGYYISYYDMLGFSHVVEFSCEKNCITMFGGKYRCMDNDDIHQKAGEIVREHRWYNFSGYSI